MYNFFFQIILPVLKIFWKLYAIIMIHGIWDNEFLQFYAPVLWIENFERDVFDEQHSIF